MKKALLIVGIIGAILSTCVVGVSASMPIIMGPRASWNEAMMGIVPGSICCSLFGVIAIVGLILVLMAPPDAQPRKRRRGEEDR